MLMQNSGLSQSEASTRLAQIGENRLKQKRKTNVATMFFSQFKDLMILILAAATLISVLMGQGTEAITIIVIVLLNAIMGFVQEYRTEKTLEALSELSAPTAHVRRDGKERVINARTVVPGDILLVEPGDKIAADCKTMDAVHLSCNEAMLTGESVPAQKKLGDGLFMGCIVMTGHGEGIVTATGMNTEMGKIANLVESASEDPTPLQIKLKQLGKFVAITCVVTCLAVGFLGYLQGNAFLEMLLTGVSLAVAAIPEGLPAIVTITLALSVNRILKRGAVIRKLHAVETLGCAGVICTDKTGTITQNQMTVRQILTPSAAYRVTGDGICAEGSILKNEKPISLKTQIDLAKLFTASVLCTTASITRKNIAFEVMGDPTETAILVAAAKIGFTKEALLRACVLTGENSFDSKRKRMSVAVRAADGEHLYCKGAPDLLLTHCTHIFEGGAARPINSKDKERALAAVAVMGGSALRVLGVAMSDTPLQGEKELCYLGILGMLDPPRAEVRPAVQKCRRAGIKPVMITGDYKDTALAVARDVGIARAGDSILDGAQLDAMTDAQLAAACMKTSVYARVSPAHKLRIVRAYKAAGQVVAMTGDGVNCEYNLKTPNFCAVQKLGVYMF